MNAERKGSLIPSAVGLAFVACAGIAFLFMMAGVDLAWTACDGSFTLFAENPRCRWPAVYSYVFLACAVGALVAFGIAVFRRVRKQ